MNLDFNNLPKEDLREELTSHARESSFGRTLHHPLIVEVFYHEEMNAYYNKFYEQKVESLAKAEKEENWHSYIFLHERPYRLEAFMKIRNTMLETSFKTADGFPNKEIYYELMGSIWCDSENIFEHLNDWILLLDNSDSQKIAIMDTGEQLTFEELPDEFIIYRGHQKQNKKGISFSLSEEKAEWFANRYKKKGKVRSVKVKKEDCFAYLNSRNEQEILYLGDFK